VSLRLLFLIFVRFCGRLVAARSSPRRSGSCRGRPRVHRLVMPGTVVRWHWQRPHERRQPRPHARVSREVLGRWQTQRRPARRR